MLKFGGYFQVGRVANTIALSADNVVIASILGAPMLPHIQLPLNCLCYLVLI